MNNFLQSFLVYTKINIRLPKHNIIVCPLMKIRNVENNIILNCTRLTRGSSITLGSFVVIMLQNIQFSLWLVIVVSFILVMLGSVIFVLFKVSSVLLLLTDSSIFIKLLLLVSLVFYNNNVKIIFNRKKKTILINCDQ